MTAWPDQLYKLLPAVHQIRDAENGEALRAFLQIVGEQTQQIHEDIDQLYDNWFIETCDDWVVPYIGDLVGFRRSGASGEPADAITPRGQLLNRFLYPRREIANLVRRRRRKGTLSVLEEMAKDVSGWSSRAVEFSRLITFFQNVKHPQPEMGQTFSLRDTENHPRLNTPFGKIAHTVDVRSIQPLPGVGWYHPKKVGLFVWRRKVLSATMVCPCRTCCKIVCPKGNAKEVAYYTFNRVGIEAPIYVRPVEEPDELHIAIESNLPVPLYRHLLADKHGHANDTYYGLGGAIPKSLAIYTREKSGDDWSLIPGDRICVADLGNEALPALSGSLGCDRIAVDPERGILLFGCQAAPCEVRVSYHYASTMDMGGGEYERQVIDKPATAATPAPTVVRVRSEDCCTNGNSPNLLQEARRKFPPASGAGSGCKLRGADDVLKRQPDDPNAKPCADSDVPTWTVLEDLCIEISESDTFQIPANETLRIEDDKTLIIRAARGAWPLLHLHPADQNNCPSPWRVQLGSGSTLVIDGLLVAGVTMQLEDYHSGKDTKKRAPNVGCAPCGDAPHSESVSQLAGELHLRHTTFVPGGRIGPCRNEQHASLCLRLSLGHVVIRHSITGTVNVEHARCANCCGHDDSSKQPAATCPLDPVSLEITDSIVDAANGLPAIYSNCCSPAHADVNFERSTILGDICVQQISRAEDSLFTGIVHVQRRGHGYMRFCYVPSDDDADHYRHHHSVLHGPRAQQALFELNQMHRKTMGISGLDPSKADLCGRVRTPPRFKCIPEPGRNDNSSPCSTGCGDPQPAAVSMSAQVYPAFFSESYGQPGYSELALDCDSRILTGSEDQSEFGVFHDLYRPQRDAALRSRLQEYTPADMQSAIIYADDLHPARFGNTHHHTSR